MSNNINNFKELLKTYSVKIPIIQRDYAQGRNDGKTEKIREKFLNSIFDALKSGENLHLDFVYGSVKNNIFTPLDGQQRLTTLFLLHLYFGENTNLNKFSYETRASSREFCEKLIENMREIKKEFLPDTDDQAKKTYISEQIKDRPWFMAFWEQDPTVKSMLTMLDDICQKANKNKINPENLDKLTFSLLKISDFGLDDDLYIKMNARGKPLNEFENFKAEFEKFLDNKFKDKAENIAIAIDTIWTDNFFTICKDPEKTFEAMVNYKDFIFEMLFYKNADKLDENSKIEDIKEGKNDYNKVLKETNDLEFLKFAFENINDILDTAEKIFDVYWDGKSPYDKKDKVCIFDDMKENFYKNGYKAKLGNSSTEKECNVFEIMPTDKFNLDQKIYLYCLIFLLKNQNKKNIANKLTNIRNKHNDRVLLLRSNSISFEINRRQYQIAKDIKGLEKELREDIYINESIKKLQDYKYFRGNINILDGDIELGETIIELLSSYNTNIIIANLVYYGFEGWVMGKVWGDDKDYTKRLFGGEKAWHTMLRSRNGKDEDGKDWVNNKFGGLKEVFTELKEKRIINFDKINIEKCLATKGIKKNSWRYYFIKYRESFFENDERNIFAWYGTNAYWCEIKELETSLKIEKISTNADRNIKKTSGDENPFKKYLMTELKYEKKAIFDINSIKLGNKPAKVLDESYDIIEEIIKQRS
ncbi:DUF262 domain-containing protein [Campylobacter hyointestinalis]|uniref:DUF262 domain-containing protein n=1 Tax=Campylobacter hyointestinalis TaxID=198 RepID=A0A562X8P8_CAMHY|nr:DUF262 domain-containing protein [Campylobacter hyointestinalis]TWO18530.1 DUF262 domain-containing protein [Campylobacter hyointestinalis]